MKKWVLWTMVCTICVAILLSAGSFFDYTGNKIKLNIPIKVYKENDYAVWEERKLKETPNYDNLAIFVDINSKTLEVINLDNREVLKQFIIASGKTDTPSPIGSWKIVDKSKWGKGFGTRWMGLNVPWATYREEHPYGKGGTPSKKNIC